MGDDGSRSELSVREAGGLMAIDASGTLDVFLAPRLADAALHCAETGLDTVLDCSALERLDASCLQILLGLNKALRASERSLTLRAVPPSVKTYLELAGARMLTLEEARAAAEPDDEWELPP
jgi:anti-anti-sigma factor